MSLKRLLNRTLMLIEQGMYETKKAFRSEDGPARALQVTQLEQRILMSASPAAAVAAAPAEATAAIGQVDVPAISHETAALTEQQYLDIIADQVLPEAQTTTSDQPSSAAQTLELVFLDSSVSNLQQMIDDLQQTASADPSTTLEVIVLDSSRDGIAQITAALLNYNGIDGMHIVSHGSDGQVQLGSTTLSLDNLDRYRSAISAWQYSMSEEADILIYGCNVAATANGQELLNQISELTATDVAASDDVTGHEDLGGDWILEYTVGDVSTDLAFSYAIQSSWYSTLDITTGLVGHYEFDTTPGSTIDSAGNQDATASAGGIVSDPDSIVGDRAADFSADASGNSFLEVADNAAQDFGAGSWSVAFWYQQSGNPTGDVHLIGDHDGQIGSAGFRFYATNTGQIRLERDTGTAGTTGGITGTFDGTWQHVTATYDHTLGQLQWYRNGNTTGSVTSTTGNLNTTNPLRLGASSSSTHDFDGSLDDVRLYTRALSASDVTELVSLGDLGQPPGYTYPGGADNSAEWISNVTFAGINNTTGAETGAYANFTATDIATVTQGDSNTLSVSIDHDGDNYVTAWIDWNQDGDFADADEQQVVATGVATNGPHTITVDTPSDAVLGTTVMRVGMDWGSAPAQNGSTYGEFEDYGVTVLASGPQTYTVTNTLDDGSVGSLRWAIAQSNATVGVADIIDFNIVGGGTQVINVGSALTITDAVTIDGTTQTGWIEGSFLPIVIDGNDGGFDALTFTSTADNSEVRGLVLRDFDSDTIDILDGADNITIAGNFIGQFNSDGTDAGDGEANTFSGVRVYGDNVTVGGSTLADRNLISGNEFAVLIRGSATNTVVSGNYIGTDITGAATTASNNDYGVYIYETASGSTIGGATAAHGNVFAGININPVTLRNESNDNVSIQNNLIGVSADGLTQLDFNGGTGSSIFISGGADNAQILDNLIAGARYAGIELNSGSVNDGTIIQGNIIGTDATGTQNWGVGETGILIENATNTIIGGIGAGEGNVVAFSGRVDSIYGAGIAIQDSSTGASIRGNAIYSNAVHGIDLSAGTTIDGVTPNDAGDGDSGANNLQNWAVLTSAAINDAGLFSYTLDTTTLASGTYQIDFYASTDRDGGQVEGQRFLGTGGFVPWGNASYSGSIGGVTLAAGEYVTAVITDSGGNSSEFSNYAVATDSDAGGSAPSDLQTAATTEGGLSINADGGNNVYLIADNGDAILGGRTQLSFETRFKLDAVLGSETLMSYHSSNNESRILLKNDGALNVRMGGGTSVDASGINYTTTLADGNEHTLSTTWTNAGDFSIYIDGQFVETLSGVGTGATLGSGGALVFGQEQDGIESSFSPAQAFSGTLYDVRFFEDLRTAGEIAASYRSDLPYDEAGMIANWKFDQLSTDGVVTDAVSGNNLTVKHVTESGFTAGEASLTFSLDENALDDTLVGQVYGVDAEREAQIASLLAADANLRYNAETGKFYKAVTTDSTWTAASTSALSTNLNGVGGQLATIRSAAENEIVTQFAIDAGKELWLGASDATVDGSWHWYEDGIQAEQFWQGEENGYNLGGAFTGWQPGRPDNRDSGAQDYLSVRAWGEWNDEDNAQANTGYIIEWDADEVLDATQALTYTIASQTVAGTFAIDTSTGQITVANGALLDYESNTEHTLTVRTTDAGGNTHDQAFTVSLNNLVEADNAPTDLSSGIELNTDGGNDAYLQATNGGAILSGLGQLTFETQFQVENGRPTFASYASAGQANEFNLYVNSGGNLAFHINGGFVATSLSETAFTDGDIHSLAFSWDNTAGAWSVYLDGQLADSGTGHAVGATLDAGGTLIFGQEQDSQGGGFESAEAFQGTLYDVRIWNEVRSEVEIALNYQNKFDVGNLPSGLIANWQMDGFNGSNQVVDIVSGNNLSIGHATGAGFTTSTPRDALYISENSPGGTSVGFVVPSDPDAPKDIVSDGLFLEGTDPGFYTTYVQGQSFGDWTVRTGNVEHTGTHMEASPLGGHTVDLNGSNASGGIFQTLSTEAGRQYQVVFALSGNFGGGEAVKDVRVSAGGESNDFAITEPSGWSMSNMLWQHRSFTFTADSATTDLDFLSLDAANNAGPVIADVQVIEIPQAVTTILNNDPTLSYDAATGKFYRLVDTITQPLDAIDAATSATLNGVNGQLATIRSAYENELIRSFAQQAGGDVLLGGRDATTEGNWYFLDGATESEQFSTGSTAQAGYYTNWRAAEPNGSTSENQLAIRPDGEWQDVPDNQSRAYVIEWDASEVLSNFKFEIANQDTDGPLFAVDSSAGEVRLADPTTPETYANQLAWYDASDATTITESGGIISAVTDKTTGNDLTQGIASYQPTLASGAINGLDAIQFGGDDLLELSNSGEIRSKSTERAITIVFEASSDVTTRQVLFEQGREWDGINLYIDGGKLYAGAYSDEGSQDWQGDWITYDISGQQTYVATLVIDAEARDMRLHVNGEFAGSAVTDESAVGAQAGSVFLGGYSNGARFHDEQWDFTNEGYYYTGLIGEFSYNDAVLRGDEVVDLHAHLMNKWIDTPTSLDYETATSHNVTVQVTDAAGNSHSEVMSIAVDNEFDVNQTIPIAIQNVDEDSSLVFSSGNGNAVSVSDSLSGTNTPMQVFLSVNNGILTLSQTTGLTIPGGANGSSFMTIQGSESDINLALEGLTYTPTANYNGSDSLSVTTSLGANLEGHYTFEGGNAIDQSVGISQNGTLVGNATTVVDPQRGEVLSLDGSGDFVEINSLLGSPANVTLSAWVNLDAVGTFGSEVISIGGSVGLRADDGGGVSAFFWDGSNWQVVNSNINVAGTGWRHVAFTLDDAGDVQTVYMDGVAVGFGNATGSLVYNHDSVTRIGSHTSNSSFDFGGLIDDARIYTRALSADEIAALATDQTSTTGTVAIQVDAGNDAPVKTAIEAAPLAYTENDGAVAITSTLAISDIDDTHIESALVAITGNYTNGQDVLDFANQNGITGSWNATTGELTLTGSATLAQYETALRSITYTNTSESPSTASRTVSFTVNDGDASSTTQTRDIAITAVNDAPIAVADTATAVEAGGTANATAGTNPTGNVLTNDTDVDSGDTKTVIGVQAGTQPSTSGSVGASVTGAFGTVTVNSDGSYTYTVDNNNSAVQALRGSSDTLTDTFSYTVQDSGGAESTTQLVITIDGQNDAPEAVVPARYLSASSQTAETGISGGAIYESAVIDGVTFARNMTTHPNSSGTSYVEHTIDGAETFKATIGIGAGAGAEGDVIYRVYVDGVLQYSSPVISVASGPRDIQVDTTGGTTLRLEVDNVDNSVFDWARWANARFEGGTVSLAVDENAANGTVVGSVSSVDVDWGDNATYALTNTAGGRFAIDSNTGQITVANGSAIDFEDGGSYSVTIQATDVGGLTHSQTLSITVNDVAETPIGIVVQSPTVLLEDDFSDGNADGWNLPTGWSVVSEEIQSTNNDPRLHARWTDPSALTWTDYSLSVDLNVRDDDGQGVSVRVQDDGNYYRFFVVPSNGSLRVERVVGGDVGTLIASAADVVPNLGIHNGHGTGLINMTVHAVGNQFTVEIDGQEVLTLTDSTFATGSVGLYGFAQDFNSSWDNVKVTAAPIRVIENAVNGTIVAQATGIDRDAGSTLTYSLTDDAGGRFAIDVNTGAITVADGSLLDYEAATLHTVNIEVSDGTSTYSETLTISLDDNAEPFQTVPGAQTVNEDEVLTFNVANGNAVTVSDTLAGSEVPLQVSLSVNDGVLNLSGLTGITIVEGANGSGSLVINGTESAINAAFEGMRFTPDANFNGSVTLNMSTAIAADLQGHYTFEGGNANDQSVGISQNGTFVGNATTTVDPERGEVLSLDGTGDYVEVAGRFGDPPNVTLAAWVNLSSPGTNGSDVINLGNHVALRISGTTGLSGLFYDGQFRTIESGVQLTGTEWRHVAFTFDDTNDVQTLYLDGVLVASAGFTSSISHGTSNTRIGADDFNADFDFGGLIDDARIYTRSLSADEIAALATDQTSTTGVVAIQVDAVNDAPAFTSLDDNPTFIENGPAVVLDADVLIFDAELSEIDDFNGASVTLVRNGGASSEDVFSATGALGELAQAGNLTYGGTTIGTVTTNSGGTLVLSFNSNATQALVNSTLQSIAYSNASDNPPASVQIDWTFNDGNTGSQGTGGDLTATGSTIVDITAVNDEQTVTTNTGATFDEGSTGNVITAAMLETTDLDHTAAELTYTIDSSPSNGTLYLSGVALGASETFTQADINLGRVTFSHDGSETSSANFSLTVDDGVGTTSNADFNITINPVNDNAPVITSDGGGATATINVNETISTVTTVTAVDADLPTQTITYSLGGIDAGDFTLDPSTGVLTFTAAPDFENPADDDGDNVYVITVTASDGTFTDSQTVMVNVIDVSATSLVVTTTADNDDTGLGATYTIEQLNAIGGGADGFISLREAITAANNTSGADDITFNISTSDAGYTLVAGGEDFWTIDTTSALTITDTVNIDATTQSPGAGVPVIELSGDGSSHGFVIGGQDGSEIRGFVINDFQDAIRITGGDNHVVAGNYLGTNVAGDAAVSNTRGIYVSNAANVIIGGVGANDGNVISGNTGNAINTESTAVGLQLLGNVIGLSADGEDGIANGSTGLFIRGANSVIGQTGAGNVIAASANNLLYLHADADNTTIQDNIIGSNASGSQTYGTAFSAILSYADEVLIDANTVTGKTFGVNLYGSGNVVTANTISQMGTNAIQAFGDTRILGNEIFSIGGDRINISGLAANDGELIDANVNDGMDHPIITSVNLDGTTLSLDGYVGAAPNDVDFANARVEFFNDTTGEFLGFLLTDANGLFSGDLTVAGLSNSDTVVATATSNAGSGWTSEFGASRDVNANPILTAAGPNGSFTENGTPAILDATITIADADNIDFDGGVMTVSSTNGTANDVLVVSDGATSTGNVTTSGADILVDGVIVATQAGGSGATNDLVVTFNASATADDVQAISRRLAFLNTSEAPDATTRAIEITLTDGDGGTSTTEMAHVEVIPVNDSPQVGTNTGTTVAEGGTVTITTAMLNDADVDDAGTGLTYTVTSGPTNGQVELTTNAGVAITSFTQDDIDNNRVIFVQDGTQATVDSFDFSLADGGEDGSTPATGTFNFSVTNVNDAPVASNIEGTALAYTENDGAVTITSTIAFTDVDDTHIESAVVSITGNYVATEDVLAFTNQNGITGSYDSGTGTWTLTGSATLAQYETAIRSITYTNISENPDTTTRTVSFTVNDGDDNSNTVTRDIAIGSVNDDPANVGSLPTDITVTEDVASNVDLSAIDLSDVDAVSTSLIVKLTTSTGGNLTAAAGTGITLGGNGTGALTLTGTQANLNAYLNTASNVQYLHSTANLFGNDADTINVQVNDNGNTGSGGGTDIDFGTVNVDITAVNDSPLVGTNTGATVSEGSTGNVITTAMLNEADVDDSGFDLIYTVTATPLHGALYNNGTLLGIGGAIHQSDIDAGLITYDHDGSETLSDSFDFSLADGGEDGATPATGTFALTITPVNNAPVTSLLEGPALAYTENDGPIAITSAITVTDADDTNIESAVVAISGNYANGEDVLAFSDQNGITGVWNTTTGELTLTGSATLAQYETALRSITYANSSEDPDTTTRTVSFTVNDGDANSNTQSRDIAITAVNDAPVQASIEGTALAYTENDGPVAITSTIAISDLDDTNIESAVISISGNYANGEDILAFSDQNGITGIWNAVTGELTLTGSATLAQYETALRSITYANTSDNPSVATRTVSFTVNDGDADSNTQTRDIAITAVNDAPFIAVTGASVAYTENDPATLIEPDLGISDIDSADFDSGVLTVQVTGHAAAEDSLSIRSVGIAAGEVSVSGNNVLYEGTIVGSFSGASGATPLAITFNAAADQAAVQAIGRSIEYTNSSDNPSSLTRTVSFTLTDGDGGTSNLAQKNVAITPVNDEQSVAINTGAIFDENSSGGVISSGMLLTTDVDNPASELVYTLTGNVTHGSLRLSGVALMLLDTFTQQDIDSGALTYDHDGSENLADSFDFSVDDGQATASNGTFSVTLNPVNDNAPIITSDGGGANALVDVAENTTAVTTVTATDADQPGDTLSFSLAGGVDASWFSIDANTGALSFNASQDFENPQDDNADGRYEVTVAVFDGVHTTNQSITVTISDVNESGIGVISDADANTDSVLENAAIDSLVGITVLAEDPDGTDTVSYSLDNNAGGRFAIDATTGIVTVAGAIDREAAASYDITVRATSTDTSFTTQVFTIAIGDENEFGVTVPTDTNPAENEIFENSPVGTTVGITALAIDQDATNNTVTYSLDDDAGGRFVVNPVSGEVTLSGTVDYETTDRHTIAIRATSSDGSSSLQQFSIRVLDVNEAPGFDAAGLITIDEHASVGSTVYVVSASDPDHLDVLTYSLVSGSPSLPFAIDSASGTITVTDSAALDFETTPNFTLVVQVRDNQGLTDQLTLNLALNDINEAPVSLQLTGGAIAENSAVGSVVGQLIGTDVDAGDALRYELTDNAGGRFTIDPITGLLTVANSQLLDFEQQSQHSITVRVTDVGGLSLTRSFQISLTDMNEAPVAGNNTFQGDQLRAIRVEAGVLLANASDPDGDTLTVVLVSGPSSGSLTLNADGSFTYLPTELFSGQDTFRYLVSDGSLLSNVATVTINISTTVTGTSPTDSGTPTSSDSDTSVPETTADAPAPESTGSDADATSQSDSTSQTAQATTGGLVTVVADAPGILVIASGNAQEQLDSLVSSGSDFFISVFLQTTVEASDLNSSSVSERRTSESFLSLDIGPLPTFLFEQITTTTPIYAKGDLKLEEQAFLQKKPASATEVPLLEKVVVGTSAAVSTSVSVGYVVWMLRGGSLVTAFLSSLPAWQSFDPLPLLNSDTGGSTEDEESLASIATGGRS